MSTHDDYLDANAAGGALREIFAVDLLHRELDPTAVGRPGQGVGALRGVAVVSGEPDVDMLPGQVPGPVGDVEHQGHRQRRFPARLEQGRPPPGESAGWTAGQSPWYRCSRHGSP